MGGGFDLGLVNEKGIERGRVGVLVVVFFRAFWITSFVITEWGNATLLFFFHSRELSYTTSSMFRYLSFVLSILVTLPAYLIRRKFDPKSRSGLTYTRTCQVRTGSPLG